MLPRPICGGDTGALRHWYCEQTWDHGEQLKAEQRRGFKIAGRSVTFTSWRNGLLNGLNQQGFFFLNQEYNTSIL